MYVLFAGVMRPRSRDGFFIYFSNDCVRCPTLLSCSLYILYRQPYLTHSRRNGCRNNSVRKFQIRSYYNALLSRQSGCFTRYASNNLRASRDRRRGSTCCYTNYSPYLGRPIIPSQRIARSTTTRSIIFCFLFLLTRRLLRRFVVYFHRGHFILDG